MTPFMKNHNDHMQKMAKSVARQEQIASQYLKNAKNMPNQAKYEQLKDEQFEKVFTKQQARNDFSHQNKIQTEDMRNRMAANANQKELVKQIQEREQLR